MRIFPIDKESFKNKYPENFIEGESMRYYETDKEIGIVKDNSTGEVVFSDTSKLTEEDFNEKALLACLSQPFSNDYKFTHKHYTEDERTCPFNYADERIKAKKRLFNQRLLMYFINVIVGVMFIIYLAYLFYAAYVMYLK